MTAIKAYLLLALFILCTSGNLSEAQSTDYLMHATGFSSGRTDHLTRAMDLLYKDSTTKAIGNLCAGGASLESLKGAGIDSIEERVSRLVGAGALILRDGKYHLPCIAIVGEKRDLMRRITAERAEEALPRIEPILRRLEEALKERPEFLFHVFWSRLIDETFWMLWDQEFPDDVGPPAMTYLIYPDHPCQMGTNYNSAPGHSEIAITWSFGCYRHMEPIMQGRSDLYSALSGGRVPDSLAGRLKRYGCLDDTMGPRILSYRKGDSLNFLLQELKREFVAALHGIYDYRALGDTFGIPYDDLYIILAHETAYSIFEKLDESGKLAFPAVLRTGEPEQECYRLTSIVIGGPSIWLAILLAGAAVVLSGGMYWWFRRRLKASSP